MTKAMPFLQKTILLSYDPRPLSGGVFKVYRFDKMSFRNFIVTRIGPEEIPRISVVRVRNRLSLLLR